MITYKNIAYTLLAKAVISQSMRTKGASHSHNLVKRFFEQEARDITITKADLAIVIWEEGPETTANGLNFINLTKKRYGDPLPGGNFSISETVPADWIRATYIWRIHEGDIDDALMYLDDNSAILSTLDKEGGPPVYVSFTYKFNLNDTPNKEGEQRSSIITYFSPFSNSLDMHLVFPDFEDSMEFEAYREKLQKTFPIKMKDKYFCQLVTQKNGKKVYRKFFNKKV